MLIEHEDKTTTHRPPNNRCRVILHHDRFLRRFLFVLSLCPPPFLLPLSLFRPLSPADPGERIIIRSTVSHRDVSGCNAALVRDIPAFYRLVLSRCTVASFDEASSFIGPTLSGLYTPLYIPIVSTRDQLLRSVEKPRGKCFG